MRTAIVTGGTLNDDFFKLIFRKMTFDRVIAVDGGLECLHRNQMRPHMILGDFDTVKPEILAHYRNCQEIEVKEYKPEKDATDTEIAIEAALSFGSTQIVILGGTGTRLDHTFGNIHAMKLALDKQVPCVLMNENNQIELINKHTILKKTEQFGHYVSFIPLTECVRKVSLSGFKYPLHEARLTIGNCNGVSNEIVDDEADVYIEEGILIMFQSKD